MMNRALVCGITAAVWVVTVAQGATLYVNGATGDDGWSGLCPEWDGGTCGPKATIQAGIDAAADGDRVIVADSIYTGAGNKNLDYGGKAITVQSENGPESCVIDCEDEGRGFYFHCGETAASVLDGFLIQHGFVSSASPGGAAGGGVLCVASDPTLTNCIITTNWAAQLGGGVACDQSSPTLVNCTISENAPGGFFCDLGDPTLTNCTICDNSGMSYGGGVCLWADCSATLTGCTISGNSATYNGGGLFCQSLNSPTLSNCTITGNATGCGGAVCCNWFDALTLSNCILWGNTSPECCIAGYALLTVSYSDVQGGEAGMYLVEGGSVDWGPGNINDDPLFANPELSDYHLPAESPCIEAGDPAFVQQPGATDIDVQMRVWDGDGNGMPRVDMGVDEYGSFVFGDLNCDGHVNFFDIDGFVLAITDPAGYEEACPDCEALLADCSGDGVVDLFDIDSFVALIVE